MIWCIIIAIFVTVAVFKWILPENNYAKLGKTGKFLHDFFNFKYLVIEKIVQVIYIFANGFLIVSIIGSTILLFGEQADWGIYLEENVIRLIVLFGLRILYEMSMMKVIHVKTVISINNKLNMFPVSRVQESFEQKAGWQGGTASAARFCPKCGGRLDAEGRCPNCGG